MCSHQDYTNDNDTSLVKHGANIYVEEFVYNYLVEDNIIKN